MTFWDHLDELRGVLFRSALVILLFAIVIFFNKAFIFNNIVFAPANSGFILYRWFESLAKLTGMNSVSLSSFNIELINIDLSAQFFTHVSLSLTLGLILAAPYVLYQLWRFVKPGLYDKERTAIKKAFGFASLLFFIGVLVGYLFVFPLTLRFLGTYQVSEQVVNQISLKSYMSMFTWMILIMGVVFEMPALIAILSGMGIISRTLLKKYRKYAFTILLIVAAIITPSGDAFTLFVVAIPLYLLYELSILVSRDINK